MKRNYRKIISLFVVWMMVISLVPVNILAAAKTDQVNSSESLAAEEAENQSIISEVIKTELPAAEDPEVEIPVVKPPGEETPTGEKPVIGAPVKESEILKFDGFQYSKDTNGITIIGFEGQVDETQVITIPEKIDEVNVVKIGEKAFADNDSCIEIVLPKYLVSIDKTAFIGCENLEKFTVDVKNETYLVKDGILYLKNDDKSEYLKPNNWKTTVVPVKEEIVTATDVNANYVTADFEYVTTAGGMKITKYIGSKGDIVIPDMLSDQKVVAIGDNAFERKQFIGKITLGKYVESIGNYAFRYCSSLGSISMNNGLKSIGIGAFQDCSSLSSITIPDSVTTIYADRWYGGSTFEGCTAMKTAVIGNGVTTVVDDMFRGCYNLTSVNLRGNVTAIGYAAFRECQNLKSINLPNTLKTIVNYAFYNCKNLNGVILPSSLGSIEEYAFYNCDSLESISIPASNTTLGDYTFNGCNNLKSVTLNNGLKSIGVAAFENCTALISINIPDTVTTINTSWGWAETFAGCDALQTVVVGKGLSTISSAMFYSCDNLTKVTLQGNLTTIDDSAFQDCINLKEINLPSSITMIGEEAFRNCQMLSKVILPGMTTTIGESAFRDCLSLDTITFGQSLTNIQTGAFRNCDSLKEVVLPSSLTTILGDYYYAGGAFSYCDNLTKVVIPKSVTRIDQYVFYMSPVTIYGVSGSYAQEYANANGIPFNDSIPLIASNFSANKASGQYTNTSISLSASASGGKTPYQYKFFYKLGSATTVLKDFSTTRTAAFKPAKAGTYTLYVQVKDAAGTTVTKSIADYKIVGEPAVKSFTVSQRSPAYVNSSLTLTAAGTGGNAPYQYRFYYQYGTTTTTLKGFSATNTVAFKPTKAGTYTLYTQIKDAGGKTVIKSVVYKVVATPSVKSFTANKASGQVAGTSIILTAAGTGGKTPYQYKFYYTLGKSTVTIRDFSATNTATFKPMSVGTYTLYVQVKDAGGKISTKSISNYVVKKAPIGNVYCSYRTHVENVGWQDWKTKGDLSGTSGQALRLEGIQIKANGLGNSIGVEYQTHVENIGWQDWKSNGETSGTSGQSLRLEAIRIKLTGTDASKCDIYYQVHAENFGWLDWAKNGESAGTEGFAYRLEAIRIVVVPKGSAAPGAIIKPYVKK